MKGIKDGLKVLDSNNNVDLKEMMCGKQEAKTQQPKLLWINKKFPAAVRSQLFFLTSGSQLSCRAVRSAGVLLQVNHITWPGSCVRRRWGGGDLSSPALGPVIKLSMCLIFISMLLQSRCPLHTFKHTLERSMEGGGGRMDSSIVYSAHLHWLNVLPPQWWCSSV